nr:hypothetical protein [Tanacetum cinerariifolium]
MKAICNLDVLVDSKAPKYSSPTEGKNPRAKSGIKRKKSSKHTSESTTEASKSQSGHSKKETKSSSAMNTSPSHPSPSTTVVGEMHKEAHQAAGGPTSLGDTNKDATHLQLKFLDLQHLASSVQEKLKTLDSLPCLLKTVTNTLNSFATLVENASGATTTGVPSADKATTPPAKGEKDADINVDNLVASQDEKKKELKQEYILIPICTTDPLISHGPKDSAVDDGKKVTEVDESGVLDNGREDDQVTRSEFERLLQQERQTKHLNNTNSFNTISSPVSTAGPSFANAASKSLVGLSSGLR